MNPMSDTRGVPETLPDTLEDVRCLESHAVQEPSLSTGGRLADHLDVVFYSSVDGACPEKLKLATCVGSEPPGRPKLVVRPFCVLVPGFCWTSDSWFLSAHRDRPRTRRPWSPEPTLRDGKKETP